VKGKQTFIYGLFTVMLALIVTACPETAGIGSGPVGPIGPIEPIGPVDPSDNITYHAVQVGGQPGVDSTGIEFNFSASVNSLNLVAADITVGGAAAKGETAVLTGSGTRLTLSPITVSSAGTATVQIAKPGIEAETKNFPVFKTGEIAPVLTGITADFDPGEAVFYTFTLRDSLKEHLTVTAYYDNGSDRVLEPEEYGLSGALTVGNSVITVSYIVGDITVTDKFTVTVSNIQLVSITVEFDQGTATIYTPTPLNSLKHYLTVTATYNNGSENTLSESEYTLSGTLTAGTPSITVTYGNQTKTFTPTVTAVQLDRITANYTGGSVEINSNINSLKNDLTVTAYYNDLSEKTLNAGNYSLSGNLNSIGQKTITVSCIENGVTQTGSFTVTVVCTNHDYQWVETTPPSFIEEGMETQICSRCAYEGATRTGDPSLPITTTQEWNSALTMLNGKTGNYTLKIDGDIGVGGTGATTASFGATAAGSALIVTLKGSGKLSLSSQGRIINLMGSDQTLIIDSKDLILEGLSSNNSPLVVVNGTKLELRNGTIRGNTANNDEGGGGVYVTGRGTFTMSGGIISGNSATRVNYGCSGGGVYVGLGTFTMSGGEISGNTASSYGGGVFVYYNQGLSGTFTMTGGIISGNTAVHGGGVRNDGTFTMASGKISGNTADRGGGVYGNGDFTMNSGEISGNTSKVGGGVYAFLFTMTGGIISGNSANQIYGSYGGHGGGVYVENATFTMTGGTISGNTASAIDDSGTASGGGVYVYGGLFRIVTGTVYGSGEGSLSNTITANSSSNASGAALYVNGGMPQPQRGTFSGETWNSKGNLIITGDNYTDDTIMVVNGENSIPAAGQ
jgi:hypothetical protein